VKIAALVRTRLRRPPLPTAIFTLNNVLTLGTLKAAAAVGVSIPDDVSLLGFDDYDWMEVFRPPLSAIRQPVADMAHAAWERLATLTGTGALADAPLACHVRLPCCLVWRGSVAPPRAFASAQHPTDEVRPP
jgi:LacI family transcriptional regulator